MHLPKTKEWKLAVWGALHSNAAIPLPAAFDVGIARVAMERQLRGNFMATNGFIRRIFRR